MVLLLVLLLALQSPERMFQQALDAQQRGDFITAVAGYKKVLQLQPGLIPAQANLGASLSHLGRYDEAIVQYNAALKQDPANNALRLNLALAYYKKGSLSDAADHLQKLYAENNNDTRAATLLGDCLARLDKAAEALAILTPLDQIRPGDPDVAFALGNALVRAGRKREGAQRIEFAAKKLNNAEAYRLAGEAWFDLSDFEAARKDADSAAALQPGLPGLYTLQGLVLQAVGQLEEAAQMLEKAVKANANDFRAHLYLGAVHFAGRNLKDARIHLDRALQLDPKSAMARYELALVQRASGQNEEAVKNLEQVVRGNPQWLAVHVELAALYYRVHRPEDGLKERKLVDQMSEEQQKRENPSASPVAPITPPAP